MGPELQGQGPRLQPELPTAGRRPVARTAAAAVALCIAASAAGGCSVDDVTGAGYTFSDTLPKAIDSFGQDARVISVLDRDRDVSFVVLGTDGRVHERDYELVCSSSGAGHRTACSNRTTNRQRAPLRGERDAARVRLGDLDGDVVEKLRDKTDAFSHAPVGLRGSRWVVAAGPFEGFIADVDGSNVHRAESAADREFANSVSPGAGARDPGDHGGSATGPPPDLAPPPGQLASGRPDFAAFGEALAALRARIGRRGRILFANVDPGIVVFEYVDRGRGLQRVKWEPMTGTLVDGGHPFGTGNEPDFPLSLLSAAKIARVARIAATREHAAVAPGVAINVSGGIPTISMIVHGPKGSQTYLARVDGSGLTRLG